MKREECHVGMLVRFGRLNGQQTLAEVVKVNPTRAKLKTRERRGYGRGSEVGSTWVVPYSMLWKSTEKAPPFREPLKLTADVELPEKTDADRRHKIVRLLHQAAELLAHHSKDLKSGKLYTVTITEIPE